ncbi:MAG TPA: AAA family ATPase [Candidatus Bathyarchaeia archaeon]|nr:AAA family ATPase [Candidatus Bathyarchaeia archaeon]
MDKVDLIKKMLEDNPNNGSAWYLLGLEYKEQGRMSEVLEAFSKALAHSDGELQAKIFAELASLSAPHAAAAPDISPLNVPEAIQEEEEPTAVPVMAAPAPTPSIREAAGLQVIQGGMTKAEKEVLSTSKKTITFADIGGLEGLKETIRMKIINPFLKPGLFSRFRKKVGGGILLYGPPGCGKTFIARATAGECRARFTPVHITDILDPYQGVSEQNLKDIFASARAMKPGVLFFDEVDAIGFSRSKSSSQHMRTVIDQLLAEIEGIDSSTEQLLIIGATNMPWDVDSAFKRPGRFDKLIFVAPPDEQARATIFQLKLADRPVDAIDFAQLAQQTELYSGADIENVVEIATEMVIMEIMKTGNERPISMKDLQQAIAGTKPSTIEWLRTVKNYVKYANQAGMYDDVEEYLSRVKKLV